MDAVHNQPWYSHKKIYKKGLKGNWNKPNYSFPLLLPNLWRPVFSCQHFFNVQVGKKKQAFTNCRHDYNHAHNMHTKELCVHENLCTVLISLCKNNLNLPICSSSFFALCLVTSFSHSLCCHAHSIAVLCWMWGPWIVKIVNCFCPKVLSTYHNGELLITCPHRPLCFKKTRTTITTALLISNTVVLNPYSHSTPFDP